MKNNNLPTEFINSFNKAFKYQESKRFHEAIKIYEKLLGNNRNIYAININIGNCYYSIGKYSKAAEIFYKLHEENPDNKVVLNLCGTTYLKLNQPELASPFFKRLVSIDPDNIDAWINLTHLSNMTMNNTESLYYATQALSLNPKEAILHSNLGAALQHFHRYKEALMCFETALILKPNDLNILGNIATTLNKIGNYQGSVSIYQSMMGQLIEKVDEKNHLYYGMSFPLLALGELNKGWEYYEYGWKVNDIRGRNPKRHFKKPRWNGENIKDKKLLVWREQGLGDEIMFYSLLEYAQPFCEQIIIECSTRLVLLFQRAFPKCLVRESSNFSINSASNLDDYDYQIPVGSLCKLFKSDLKKFPKSGGYLAPDPLIKKQFAEILSKYAGKKLVGISWRSGNLQVERNIHYTKLTDWKEVLLSPNTIFFNLQYGDCNWEIDNIQNEFGIQIINFPEYDFKNDLDSLAGLISNLNLVISVSTFASAFAPALGVNTKMLLHNSWDLLGAKGKLDYPWFNNVELYISPSIDTPLASLIGNITL
jgi:tetratricopeptide (TPR) repeat protein